MVEEEGKQEDRIGHVDFPVVVRIQNVPAGGEPKAEKEAEDRAFRRPNPANSEGRRRDDEKAASHGEADF